MSDGIEFVRRLESLRLAGETDRAMARRMGVGYQSMRDWKLLHDAGRDFFPKMQTVKTIAGNLGVPVEWLLLGVGEKGGQPRM